MTDSYVMIESTHYDNAPIVEAVLEATVARRTPIEIEVLADVVQDRVKYPKRVELMTASGQMTVGPTVSASATTQRLGYQFISEDKKFVIHCKLDGLAVSRLAPYTSWEDLYAEFSSYWARYVEAVIPDSLVQVAVRYINRFDLPGSKVELRDYFRTYPEVSEDIHYDVAGFLNQLQMPMHDIDGHAIVTQALVPPAKEGVISILLDIAVSKRLNAAVSNAEFAETMNLLRKKKNELFEACMKKQARDLIREVSN